MKKYLQDYISDFEKELNIPLMRKEADRPLIEYVVDCWKSLEIIKNIKILKWEYSDDESGIDINNHIMKRDKKRKKKDRVKYKFISDDRCGQLTVWIQIVAPELNPATNKAEEKCVILKKKMLVPIQDEDGYFHIKGKRYQTIYQIVEKSIYTLNQSIVLKSLMPICVKRSSVTEIDIHGIEYTLPVYNITVFKKDMPVLLFYAANGLESAVSFLGVDQAVKFKEEIDATDDSNLYFRLSKSMFLEVNKEMFDKYTYIQAVTGMALAISTNRLNAEILKDKEYWIKHLSNNNTYEKGKDVLTFFNRMLDATTKKILKIEDYHKKDIYTLLRWMIMNYNELRMKDNLNLETKRLRCNEYVASELNKEFSKRLNRIIGYGNRATMQNYKDMFKFPGNILIQKMHSSGILRYDENINDMNFFSRFKYTTKGPHSLGNKNENNIGIKNRGLHPSFAGNVDLLVCGNSDPGTSGILSPFSKIKGLYFNDENEPDNFMFEFKNDIERILSEKGIEYIDIKVDNKDDYYRIMNNLSNFNNDKIKMFWRTEDNYAMTIAAVEELDEDNA